MNFQEIADIFQKYQSMFLRGAGNTLYIAIIATLIGSVIGLIIGVLQTYPAPKKTFPRWVLKILKVASSFYIEFFRGTPMIVQSMVIYYGSLQFFGIDMNRTFAALFIVSINTGAYMSEIVRGGIISIDKGQFEAAHAIGMNHIQTMVTIILPQVIRNILPATGNEFVINIKDTSVLNVIGVTELYFQSKTISSTNYMYFQVFAITCVLYFIMTVTVTRILRFFERKMDGPETYKLIEDNKETPSET